MDGETKQFDLSNRVYAITIILIIVVAFYLSGQIFYKMASLPENTPQDISVQGQGKAYIKPDIATVSLGLKTEGKDIQTITNTNATAMNKIIKELKDLGIDEKDLQTTQYSIVPQYNWTEKQGRIPDGYSIDQNILVKIRNFDNIGKVLSTASNNGANMVGGLQFSVDNPETAKSEARQKAIAEAKQKADDIAKSAGLKIIKLVNISESYGNYPQPFYGIGGAMMEKTASVAPDIQAGQQEVDVTVYLTYRVK